MGWRGELEFSDLELVSLNNLAGAQVELGEYHQAETGLREILTRSGRRQLVPADGSLSLPGPGCAGAGPLPMKPWRPASRRSTWPARRHSSEQVGRAWRVLGRIAAYNRGRWTRRSRLWLTGVACDAHACYAAGLQAFRRAGRDRRAGPHRARVGRLRAGAWRPARRAAPVAGSARPVHPPGHAARSRADGPPPGCPRHDILQ